MVLLEAGKLSHKQFFSVAGLNDLRGIEMNADYLILGALTTYTDVQKHQGLQKEFPLLCAAAKETGLAIEERKFTVAEALAAKEAFLTSASGAAVPVVAIDGQAVGDGRPGLMTLRLQALYAGKSGIIRA